MDNESVAEVLRTIASILEIKGENVFKVRAYQNAARTVEGLGTPVADLVRDGKLGDLPGFGEALQEKVTQLVASGRMDYFEEIRSTIPAGLLEMLKVPSVGPKKVKLLHDELGIKSLRELEQACSENRIAGLKGFGAKSQAKILEGIKLVQTRAGQFRLGDAMPLAAKLVENLRGCGKVGEIEVAGSTRRWKPIVRDLDILVTSNAPEAVMAHFTGAEWVEEVIGRGPTKSSVRLRNGIQVDLRVVEPGGFAPALLYFTGSKEHNVLLRTRAVKMGLSINEYGLFKGDRKIPCGTEEEIYKRLGLNYIPPELREGADEISQAERGAFDDLLGARDIKGVFHVHSTWSDGTATIEKMAEKARAMGLKYVGLSDHSKAAAYANGLDEGRLEQQLREVDTLNDGWSNFRILKGLECDILPDGSLDLSESILRKLDFVIGSIHSRFDMSEQDMTDRICKALASKYLTMLGHPTGKLLLEREGYKVSLEPVIQCAAKHGKAIEINANPHRLDLDAAHASRARDLGVMIAINPDAHSPAGLEDTQYGVGLARRAGLRRKDVLNTRSLSGVVSYLGKN